MSDDALDLLPAPDDGVEGALARLFREVGAKLRELLGKPLPPAALAFYALGLTGRKIRPRLAALAAARARSAEKAADETVYDVTEVGALLLPCPRLFTLSRDLLPQLGAHDVGVDAPTLLQHLSRHALAVVEHGKEQVLGVDGARSRLFCKSGRIRNGAVRPCGHRHPGNGLAESEQRKDRVRVDVRRREHPLRVAAALRRHAVEEMLGANEPARPRRKTRRLVDRSREILRIIHNFSF